MPLATHKHPHSVWILLAVVLVGCGRGVDLDVARTFQEAQKTFDKSASPDDFLRAAGMYQQILDRGVTSAAVLYNQGNAFMQAGQRGRAIAAYRQALRYRPRDPYLDANLRFALGTENATARRRAIDYLFFWQNWLSYPEKFWLAGVVALATFTLALAWLVSRRRLWRNLALAGLGLTLFLSLSAGYDWYRYDATTCGVVVRSKVVARKGNAASYQPAFNEPLDEGTEFVVVDRRGDWLLVRLPGGQEGWFPQDAAVVY